MRVAAAFLGIMTLIFIRLRIAKSQQNITRIRGFRCPPVQKRDDCPTFVWDDCTCDLDCPGERKCCLDGCRHTCLEPDRVTPSVRNKADVVFIMDSSGSIGKVDYDLEKQFVKDLTDVFRVSPNETRVSTIIYSDAPKLVFDFDKYSSKETIKAAIDNLEFLGKRTRIDKALAMAVTVFSKSRPSVPRIAFVLTDGAQTEDWDAKPLDVAVSPLHDLGVQVYVIGIGSQIKRDELYLIARRRLDVFFVDSFERLLQQTYRIVNQIDTYDLLPPLDIVADMLFLLDSSSVVPQSQYQRELDFLEKIVELFTISPHYVRAGIIPFGDRAELSIPLGHHSNNEAINRSIDSLPYMGGTKRMDRALTLANLTFSQARSMVPKILLIITSGGDEAVPGADLSSPVRALREQGVTIFVIAIGVSLDYLKLNQIVPRKNLIVDKSYKALEPYLPFAASYIRVNSDFSTPLGQNAAVVFLIDSSDDVDKNDFKRQRYFVISLAKAFKIGQNGAHASVITYGKFARPSVQLKDSEDFDSFEDAVLRTSIIAGKRRMDRALRMAVRMLRDHVKPGPRVVVLFTSGPDNVTASYDINGPVMRLERGGARIYVVAIGPNVRNYQVRPLVNSSDDVIKISTFLKLYSELHMVGRYIALTQDTKRPTTPSPSPTTTTTATDVTPTPDKPKMIADVVFVMDSSSNVPFSDFKTEKDFVKDLAKSLNVSPGNSSAAVVTYGSRAAEVIGFDIRRSVSDFEKAVDNSPYINGRRRIDRSLGKVVKIMTNARPTATKLVVLLTADKQLSEFGSTTPARAARPLWEKGVNIFIIAIGRRNILELRELLPVNIFRVAIYDDLKLQTATIGQMIEEKSMMPTPITDIDADIIFIIDSSSDVTPENYVREKSLVKDMARYLNVSAGGSRAALITYGNKPTLVFKFDDYGSLPSLDNAVDRAQFVGGGRRLDLALEDAGLLLSEASPFKAKWVILLTSGAHSTAPDVKSMLDASKTVRDKSDRVYIVAIGSRVNIKELEEAVMDPNDIFPVLSFQSLRPRARLIAYTVVKRHDSSSKLRVIETFLGDIVFLVDTSSQMGTSNFESQKQFVKLVAKSLNVGPERSRAAIITYGNTSTQPDDSDLFSSLPEFYRAVDGSRFIGGPRRMNYAVDGAEKLLRTANRNVYKLVVLLTAGKQFYQQDIILLEQSFKKLRETGTKTFVVAIGSDYDNTELLPGVETAEDIFSVVSFDGLARQAWETSKEIAERAGGFQADVLFIMDSSRDVSRADYKKQKDFVVSLVKYLRLSPDETRAALLTYGYTATLVANYDSYDNTSLFANAVKRASYIGGSRRIDKALYYATQLMTGARKLLPKIVVLLTAGRQELGYTLDEEAKSLQDLGATTYIVAISNKPNVNELLPIVKDETFVFRVPSFDELQQSVLSVARELVKQPDPELPPNFRGADILFMVDSSSGVSPYDFVKEKELIKDLIKAFSSHPASSRTAFITYGNRPRVVYDLDNDMSEETLLKAIDAAQRMGGGRRTDRALDEALQLLNISRRFVPRIVLLITAGSQILEEGTQPLSGRVLREIGANTFVVAIGPKVSKQELEPVVKDSQDLFTVKTFEGLPSIVGRLAFFIVNRTVGDIEIVPPTTTSTPAIISTTMTVPSTTSTPTPAIISTTMTVPSTTTTPTPAIISTTMTVPSTTITPTPTSTLSSTTATLQNATGINADIVFLVDSSSDISPANYKKEKDFVASLARQLGFGSGNSRLALVLYNVFHMQALRFDVVDNPTALQMIFDGFVLQSRGRRLDRALVGAAMMLKQSRRNVRKIVILLTAGEQTQKLPLDDIVNQLKAANGERFVIAVGPQVNRKELTPVVDSTKDIFLVNSFDDLMPRIVEIADHISKEKQRPLKFHADVVFLIDSSSDVIWDNFLREKDFVKSITTFMNADPNDTRLAAITYGSFAQGQVGLVNESDVFLSNLNRAPYVGGQRRMDLAIEKAAEILEGSRFLVPKVVILLTAGKNSVDGRKLLANASQGLLDLGVTTYVVAIGRNADIKEVGSIVDDERDIFNVSQFARLPEASDSIFKAIIDRAERKPEKVYDVVADIVFLVDSSGDVSEENFEKEKDFIKNAAYLLNLALGKSRVSVIQYSTAAYLPILLGEHNSTNTFDEHVNNLALIGNSRRIDRALIAAATALQYADYDRPKVVILITTGKQDSGFGELLPQAAAHLAKLSAKTFVVAIGQDTDPPELKPVVRSDSDLLNVTSFERLVPRTRPIVKHIAENLAIPPVIPVHFKSDILFVMDSSSFVGKDDYESQKDFAKAMMGTFNVRPGQSRVASITYGEYSEKVLQFDSYRSVDDTESLIYSARSVGGLPRLHKALMNASDIMKDANSSFPGIVILFAVARQGSDIDEKAIESAAEKLHDLGVRVYVITVGKDPDLKVLDFVADHPQDVFTVPSFRDLVWRQDDIAKNIFMRVEEEKPERPMPLSADIVFIVDSSFDVSVENYEKEKEFVKSLVKTLYLAPGKSRGSVIIRDRIVIRLDDHSNSTTFDRAVDDLPYFGSLRRMDLGLQQSVAALRDSRLGIPTVVILLTAGRQNSSRYRLGESVKPLRNLGSKVFVVSIGSQPDDQELLQVVERPNDIIRVSAFDDLTSETRTIARHIMNRTEQQALDIDADIVFLLDSSTSVTLNNFDKEKQFAESLAMFLNVGPESSRSSIVSFGTFPSTEVIKFGDYRTLDEFNLLLDQAQKVGGTRRMDRALGEATNILAEGRRGVPHIVVLVAAGKQTGGLPLDDALEPLHKQGVHTFIVAIGHDPETSADIQKVRSFNDLPLRAYQIARHIKSESEPRPANISADIVFLVDSSTPVGQGGFDREKSFVKSLAKYLNVSPQKSKAAVIAYNDTAYTVLKFTDYQTEVEFSLRLDLEEWFGGIRNITGALEGAATLLGQARANSPKIVVLVTAGRHISGDIIADSLKKLAATVIVVTVGSDADYRDFLPVVDSIDDLFVAPSFDDLGYEVQPIVKYIVKRLEPPVHDITEELVFILDASANVGTDNFGRQKAFVKLLARSLNVAPGGSRAALITYSNNAVTVVPLGGYETVHDFESTLDRIVFYYGGERRMDLALEEAADLFQKARAGVQRKVILLTGGTSTDDQQALEGVKMKLREAGALPFIIAVGSGHDFSKLSATVNDPKDIFKVPSFQELLFQVKSTAEEVVSRKMTLPLKKEYIVFLLDSSSTVRPEQFTKQKSLIKILAKYLNVGSANKTKSAVINYGGSSFTSVKFDDSSTLRDFERGVDKITPRQGNRRIDLALDEAQGILRQTDSLSLKILVLLTTGRQAQGLDVKPLSEVIKPIQDMGTRTYVIAIGSEPNTRELKSLVGKTQDIFRVLVDIMEREVPRVIDHIRKENPRPGPKNDFVFLMDSSSDVTRLDFTQEILFVKSLARELSISSSEFQAAVIAYGNRFYPVVRFNSYNSLREFYTAMDSGVYQGGARRMDRALTAASEMLSSRNPESRKTVVLITGGSNSQEAGPGSLEKSVQSLTKLGAKIIIVAFGNRIDAKELLPLVQQQQDIHPVQDASYLTPYVGDLSTIIIFGTSAPITKQPDFEADVIFVIDSSYDVKQDDYKAEKEFIKSLVRDLELSTNSSRAAFITYGDRSSIASRFVGLKDLAAFDVSVNNASYVGGTRRIDRALQAVARLLEETRRDTPKLVILLTAGNQTSGVGSLGAAVDSVRQFGAKTFVVAIGDKPDVQKLKPLVGSPDDVVTVVSFKELKSQSTGIANHIGETAVALKPESIVDVVFLMDSSKDVNFINFIKEKAYVKLLAKRLNVSPGKSRAAVVVYGSSSQLRIDFDAYHSLSAFKTAVDGISYIGGTRRIDKALETAAVVLKKARNSIPKMVVLLTTGQQPLDAPSLASSAGALHLLGAMVYVISISNNLDSKYFGNLVEEISHVSQVSTFDLLNNTLPQVIRRIEDGVTSRMQVTADVVFLMDASTAENPSYFTIQKDLIKSMVRNLGASTDKLRASLIVYSSSSKELTGLMTYTSLRRFEETVDRAAYVGGERRIDKALAAAVQQLSQSRQSATKIVVLITTGLQARVLDRTPLSRASQPLRDANAHVLVIGIGKQPDVRELNLITRNPQDVKIIPSPKEVVINVHLLARRLIKEANKETGVLVLPRANLIFLLDSSTDVTSSAFKEQKNFIKSIVEHFQIGVNKTQVAVIRYSSSASPIISFNTYDNLLNLLRGIENIQYYAGDRRMDAALKEANKMRERARLGVPTYVIVLTGGRQSVTSVPTPLNRAAQPLLNSNARMIVVGVGSRVDYQELRSMAERDGDVFRFSPDELPQQAPLFVVYMTSQEGTPLPKDFKADFLFLVDSSQSINQEKFQRELDFVKAFARTLDIAPDKSRIGVITFGDSHALSVQFDDYNNIKSLLRGVDAVPKISGEKRLDEALYFAARVLSQVKDRTDSHKILVVLTDGKQALGRNSLNDAARLLKQIGVKVIVVGVGGNVDIKVLETITSRLDDLFYSRSFEELIRQVPVITDHVLVSFGTRSQHQVRHGLFLVDSSVYRSTSEFLAQVEFIKSIAKRLDVSPNGTRAGVILYGSDPQLSIGLNDYGTFLEFYTLLDNLTWQGGEHQLHKALQIAGETLQKSPEAVPKFVVAFVEGEQYGSNGMALLRDAAKPLQVLGVTVYAVGIGNRLNRQELVTITESSEHIVNVTRFSDLLGQVEFIARLIDITITAPCRETLDVGFVIDASGSMGLDKFSREKNFLKLVSRRFVDSSPDTRLGVISFSDTAKLFADFVEFERMGIDQFQKILDELPYQGGRTRIDRALMAASQHLFTKRRPGVQRVLVLVSDGRQSKDPDSRPLKSAVKPLTGQRVKVIAVGFGDNLHTEDLTTLTGSADNILSEKVIGDIDRLQRELVSKACSA